MNRCECGRIIGKNKVLTKYMNILEAFRATGARYVESEKVYRAAQVKNGEHTLKKYESELNIKFAKHYIIFL